MAKSLFEVKSFGGTDADTDDLLELCFQEHEAYTDAIAHGRWLVLGRKGAGKTAIFRKVIRTRSHNFFSFGHTFSDYPWEHHRLQGAVGVPEDRRFIQSWQYLILMTLAKLLLNRDQSQPWSEDALDYLQRIESFVIDSYGSRDPDLTQLFSPAKHLRITPHLKVAKGWGELGVNVEQLPMSHLPRVFQEVNSNIEEAVFACLNPGHDYFICFDELDRGFDPDKAEYNALLVGLLLAARLINIKARERGAKLSVLVFLRDDIYGTLQFEDKNKITEAFASRVEWDTERTKWTLKRLMEKRFSTVLESEEMHWDKVYDEAKQMSGRQSKYQYILDRTFNRPRDMIHYCNDVLAAFQKRPKNIDQKFTNDDVNDAKSAYSEYLYNELHDEVPKHIASYDDDLELLKALGVGQFDRETFLRSNQSRLLASTRGDPIRILSDLFLFSIVAYQKTGGLGGGSEYVFRYLDSRARFDPDAKFFRIHPGLLEALDLKRYSRR